MTDLSKTLRELAGKYERNRGAFVPLINAMIENLPTILTALELQERVGCEAAEANAHIAAAMKGDQ